LGTQGDDEGIVGAETFPKVIVSNQSLVVFVEKALVTGVDSGFRQLGHHDKGKAQEQQQKKVLMTANQ
jgi:hypothetical protein